MIKSMTLHNQIFGGASDSSAAKPECTPAHPDAFIVGWFEGLICSAATGAGMTPSTDPTSKGQLGDFEKFINDISSATAGGDGKMPSWWIIVLGVIIAILILKKLL